MRPWFSRPSLVWLMAGALPAEAKASGSLSFCSPRVMDVLTIFGFGCCCFIIWMIMGMTACSPGSSAAMSQFHSWMVPFALLASTLGLVPLAAVPPLLELPPLLHAASTITAPSAPTTPSRIAVRELPAA